MHWLRVTRAIFENFYVLDLCKLPHFGSLLLISRAHSFPRTAGFRAVSRNLGFYKPSRGAEFTTEFAFFRGFVFFSAEFVFPRSLMFFIRTTQKMPSMLMAD